MKISNPFMNNIIFSFNRPAQLDLFIRSYLINFLNAPPLKIIYRYSNELAEQGYNLLKEKYPNHHYICENKSSNNFKELTVSAINKKVFFTTFFVDDIVFINPFRGEESPTLQLLIKNSDISCASLRLYPGITYSYMGSRTIIPPKLDSNFIWKLPKKQAYWSYPMSVDGHIFRTNEIYDVINKIQFNNPNQLEYQLSHHPLPFPKMICFEKPIIVNIPANKVQSTYVNNRSLNVSVDLLNKKFLSGQQINLKPLQGIQIKACHEEIEYSFEKIKSIQTSSIILKYKEIIVIGDLSTLNDMKKGNPLLGRPGYLLNGSIHLLPDEVKKTYFNYKDISSNDLEQYMPHNSMIIVHVDQTFRDNNLLNLIKQLEAKGHNVYNGQLNNISKRFLDQLAIQLGLEPLEIHKPHSERKVFLKSDYNCDNTPKDLRAYRYKVKNKDDIPEELWNDKRMFMCKYIETEVQGLPYLGRVERVYFMGDEHVFFAKLGDNKSEIKYGNSISYPSRPNEKFEQDFQLMQKLNIIQATHSPSLTNQVQLQVLNYTKKIQSITKMLVGSVEFIQDKNTGKIYFMDLNPTSYSKDINNLFINTFSNELLTYLKRA